MTTGDDTIVRRYADAMERRGEQIVLRRLTAPGGNPPTLVNPVLAADVVAGAVSVSLNADQAAGSILAGDKLVIGSAEALVIKTTVLARVSLDQPGFDAVLLDSGVLFDAAAGTAVNLAWQADQLVWAYVQSFPVSLQSDQRIGGDWNVIIAAYGVASPTPIDEVVIDEKARQIVSVDRLRQRGETVAWNVHAR